MAQAHAVQGAGPVQPGAAGHGNDVEHISHPGPRTYVLVFVILAVVTALEVAVAVDPLHGILADLPVPLPPGGLVMLTLLALAVAKGLLIVAFYMHLKTDSRVFSAFFTVGIILAMAMILSFMALFFAHYRLPFDEISWREQQQQQGQQAGQQGGGTAGGGH